MGQGKQLHALGSHPRANSSRPQGLTKYLQGHGWRWARRWRISRALVDLVADRRIFSQPSQRDGQFIVRRHRWGRVAPASHLPTFDRTPHFNVVAEPNAEQ